MTMNTHPGWGPRRHSGGLEKLAQSPSLQGGKVIACTLPHGTPHPLRTLPRQRRPRLY